MAFEQLFVRTKKHIGGISLDAVLEETHDTRVTVTNNPVEFGVDITDHAVFQPVQLTIVATVSDTPLGVAALGIVVDNITGLFGRSTTDAQTRSSFAYQAMVALQAQREPIEVQTKLKLYENMLITGVTVAQDKNSSREAHMVITLKQIQIVNTQIVTLSEEQLGISAKVQAAPPVDRGRQQATPVPTQKSRSWLSSILGIGA